MKIPSFDELLAKLKASFAPDNKGSPQSAATYLGRSVRYIKRLADGQFKPNFLTCTLLAGYLRSINALPKLKAEVGDFQTAIRVAVEKKLASPKELGKLLDKSEDTIFCWLKGERLPMGLFKLSVEVKLWKNGWYTPLFATMTNRDLLKLFWALGLGLVTPEKCAEVLSVAAKTITDWATGRSHVNAEAQQVLERWIKTLELPPLPTSEATSDQASQVGESQDFSNFADSLATLNQHAIRLLNGSPEVREALRNAHGTLLWEASTNIGALCSETARRMARRSGKETKI